MYMCNEEEKKMAVSELTLEELRAKIRKITDTAPILGGKDGMIELNPNNPHHREWYEDDEDKE
jgi:hypothetical protein